MASCPPPLHSDNEPLGALRTRSRGERWMSLWVSPKCKQHSKPSLGQSPGTLSTPALGPYLVLTRPSSSLTLTFTPVRGTSVLPGTSVLSPGLPPHSTERPLVLSGGVRG